MNLTCFGQDAESLHCNCSISDFKHRVYPAAYLFIFTLGLLGNVSSLCVFVSHWRNRKTLTSVNLYLVNLLVSDLMLVCSLPFRAAYYLTDSGWVYGDFTCRLISYVFYINMYSSVYFMVALSVMRYLAVMRPYVYVRLQTSRSTRVVCAVIWLFVSMVSTPLLAVGNIVDGAGRAHCLELDAGQLDKLVYMNYGSMFLSFLLPFFVISVCYIFVIRSLLCPRRVPGSTRPCYKKSSALVIIIMAIFLVCFLPYHVVRTLFLEAERDVSTRGYGASCGYIASMRKAAVVTLCLATGNSCLDPILYFLVGENFRELFHKKCKKERKPEDGTGNTENHVPRNELIQLQGLAECEKCQGPEAMNSDFSEETRNPSGFHNEKLKFTRTKDLPHC